MPIKIIRNDITKIQCDAIVNAAKTSLLGGGGVDGAIHRAAGPGLLQECMRLGGCKVGQAKITRGYQLPCRYVIHTVGPRWVDGRHGEKELLESCYRQSLELARSLHCRSVAFPLISSGIFGYPKDQALKVAVDTITQFLMRHEMLVYITIFDRAAFRISGKLFADIASYIDDKYVDEQFDPRRARPRPPAADICEDCAAPERDDLTAGYWEAPPMAAPRPIAKPCPAPTPLKTPSPRPTAGKRASSAVSLADRVRQLDESFSQMLLRKIDEKGMKDAECYKKANVDRKLFSKIRSDVHYRPSKTTAIAFAIALELSLDETKDMLMKAGFALSHSSKFDIIIEYFIVNRNYNIFEINEALFAFDQSLLG